MGYIRHHAIVVTSWKDESIEAAHAEAMSIFKPTAAWVSQLTPPAINGQRSFFIAPDGSKERWNDSDEADAARTKFIAWADTSDHYLQWVEVEFGGDEPAMMQIRGSYGGARCWEGSDGEVRSSPLPPDRPADAKDLS